MTGTVIGNDYERSADSYWRLIFDPNDPKARTVTRAEVDWSDPDIVNLSLGYFIKGDLSAKVKLRLRDDDGPIEDLIPNPQGWLVCSERLVSNVLPLIQNSVQTFKVPLYDTKMSSIVLPYYLVHVIDVKDCIVASRSIPRVDPKTKKRKGFIEYTIDPVRAEKSNIFRYSDPPDYIDSGYTCSATFLAHIAGSGFTGIGFIECAERTSNE